jgi:23S rRNA pseudouridine1911/1915/1917 synthase
MLSEGGDVRRVHLQFKVSTRSSGMRLDRFLATKLTSMSRMRIAALIAENSCLVNKVYAPPGQHIETGDLVEVEFDPARPSSMTPQDIPLSIQYEDDYIIVVVKPAEMLVHPTRSVKTGTLANALAFHLNRASFIDFASMSSSERQSDEVDDGGSNDVSSFIRPGLVHRLDRATSGLMVVAKTRRTHAVLSRHFRRRFIEKRYLALVQGEPGVDSFIVDSPIGRDPDRRPQWWVSAGGKPAETRMRVLERVRGRALLEVIPITGRTNQIRIHSAFAGYPIVGDSLYSTVFVPENSEDRELPAEQKERSRLCLHASFLGFHHPATGKWMEVTSDLPDDWPV